MNSSKVRVKSPPGPPLDVMGGGDDAEWVTGWADSSGRALLQWVAQCDQRLGIWDTPSAVSARIAAKGSFPENVWGF